MGAPLAIRTDIGVAELRRLARRERDGRVAARLLALANVLVGMRRVAAARAAGMDRQTLRDWVIRFNAEGVAGLRDRPRPGRPPRLTEGQQAAFKAIVLRGPDPERDGVSAWRIIDLCRIAAERFGVAYREGGMLRLVKSLGLSWQKIRPRHPKADGAAQERFERGASPPRWARWPGATRMPRCSSGARTRPGSARRAAAPGFGSSAASGPRASSTSATPPPGSTPPSVPAPTRHSRWSCPRSVRRPCRPSLYGS
jgi:transposase